MCMIGFLLSLVSDYGRYALIAAAAIAAYFWWESRVEDRAMLRFNQSQMEQLLKDQQELSKKLTDIRQLQDQIIENEKQFKQNLDKKLSGITNFLSSDEAKRMDRPASEILKRTLKELSQ